MTSTNDPLINKEWLELCHSIALKLFESYQWGLVDDKEQFVREEVVSRAIARSQAQPARDVVEVIRATVLYCYCEVWYAACCDPNSKVYDQAYAELVRYLQRSLPLLLIKMGDEALSRDIDFLEMVQQEVFERVLKAITTVTNPGAFLGWIGAISRFTLLQLLRQAGEERSFQTDSDAESDEIAVMQMPDGPKDWGLSAEEFRDRLLEVLEICLRSIEQRMVIATWLLHGMTLGMVATTLNMTARNVYQRKTRALETLRKCPAMLDFASFLDAQN